MPQIRGIKCVKGISASPMTLPNKEDCESCVKCNKPTTADSFECVWCERWQHGSCTKISAEQVPSSSLPLRPICQHHIFLLSVCEEATRCIDCF